MDEKVIRTAWSFFGLLGSAFSFAAVLRTAGVVAGSAIFPMDRCGRYSVSIIAIPLGTILLLLVLWLTRRYPVNAPNGAWSSKIPVFYFEPERIDPHHPDGRKYQMSLLLAFIIFPWVAQLRFFYVFIRSKVVVGPKGKEVDFAENLEHFVPTAPIDWSRVLSRPLTSGERDYYRIESMSYVPIVMPWLYLALHIVLLCFFISTLRYLFDSGGLGPVKRMSRRKLAQLK